MVKKGRYQRRLQFYETDAMGIIHHANYLLYMEEARLEFLRQVPVKPGAQLLGEINYPVIHCHVDYKQSLRFGEDIFVDYAVRVEGARLIFEYSFLAKELENPLAFGKTIHVAFDMVRQKPIRLPKSLLSHMNQLEPNHGP